MVGRRLCSLKAPCMPGLVSCFWMPWCSSGVFNETGKQPLAHSLDGSTVTDSSSLIPIEVKYMNSNLPAVLACTQLHALAEQSTVPVGPYGTNRRGVQHSLTSYTRRRPLTAPVHTSTLVCIRSSPPSSCTTGSASATDARSRLGGDRCHRCS